MPKLRKRQGARSSKALFDRLRQSTVPEGGWTRENFTGAARDRLTADTVMARRLAVSRGIRDTTKTLARLFPIYVAAVANKVEEALTRQGRAAPAAMAKAQVDLNFTSDLAMWEAAIRDVLGLADAEIRLEMTRNIQSVLDEVADRTSSLLGNPHNPSTSQLRLSRAQRLASQITGINSTTQDRIRADVVDAYERGLTPRDVAAHVRARAPQIANNRIPTIARTEMGRAADEGTKQSIIDSGIATFADVVGCAHVEANSPTYQGTPTCNIRNVPVHDINSLEFHINHTGAIIVSGFRDESGSSEVRQVLRGIGEED